LAHRILLTGVTGALGRALLPELLDRGFEVVCLIRPKVGMAPKARLRALTVDSRAIAVQGDITLPLCGLHPDKLPKIDKLVHAAADTSLDQASLESVAAANRAGTRHALDLALALGRPEFHYVGTAYIAGDAPVLAEQDGATPLVVGTARNPYEASKVDAERMVRSYPGTFTVLRPSIVVGRSDDGSAPQLTGIYSFFRSVSRIREAFRRGNYKDERGVRISRGYKLQIPISIRSSDDVALNLIQLDWLSRTEAALIALPARGRTYNLTHPQSMRLNELVHHTINALDLAHVSIVDDTGGFTLSPIKLAIRRLVQREMEHLRPYLLHSPAFVSRNLYEDLGPGWPEPPAITRDFIRMTMHASEKGWHAHSVASAAE
jgi:nucleoside-diphosphate-sugar epimerase